MRETSRVLKAHEFLANVRLVASTSAKLARGGLL